MELLLKRTKPEITSANKQSAVKQTWLDPTNDNQSTPLLLACMKGHYGIIELLVNLGADVQATDKDGDTAIHLTAMRLRKLMQANKSTDVNSAAMRLSNLNIGGSHILGEFLERFTEDSGKVKDEVPTADAPKIREVRS